MDKFHKCKLFKSGQFCPRVQYCNYDNCRERMLYEILIDEEALNIPYSLRLYNTCPELYSGQEIENNEKPLQN